MENKILQGDCIETLKTLPDKCINTCITSPPYYGLRDYGCDGQIGLEETPEAYVEKLVDVFREVWRVLRDDGTVWLNLGDSYATSSKHGSGYGEISRTAGVGKSQKGCQSRSGCPDGLKPKDLIGIPWRVAFALQADGWYLRQDIIWHKPNPMPESVTDRCTKSHEYIFLLSKSQKYYYDNEAIKEDSIDPIGTSKRYSSNFNSFNGGMETGAISRNNSISKLDYTGKRNKRSVWTVNTKPYKEAHFAVFPPDLIIPCIKASTSEYGNCSKCGSPYKRRIEKEKMVIDKSQRQSNMGEYGRTCTSGTMVSPPITTTTGWAQFCSCENSDISKPIVLDPFGGSGTTAETALRLNRKFIICELNKEYIELARKRIQPLLDQGVLF